MGEMIKRVATAICKEELSDARCYGDEICCQFGKASRRAEGGHNYPDRPGPLRCCREDYEDVARAAIECMREPTDEMVRAADKAMQHRMAVGPSRFDTWRAGIAAMIDAILAEN